ncbi:30S ribosomal protein S6e [Candidatus Parvarchaeota archaeon]|nr:30S ribosomal protein S6e [Candidatus Parvarchaeota archaeon]
MEIKLVINDPKSGKSYNKTLSQEESETLLGKKIGEETDLSFIGLDGYSGMISGGSYMTGTPMMKSADGTGLKRILTSRGFGNRRNVRLRKSVAGNTFSQFSSQVDIKITKYGEKTLEEIFPQKKENNG